MSVINRIICLLEDYIEEDDNDSLEQALILVKNKKIDINKLLNHLENFKGDLPRKRRAINSVRKHLGLSLIPGPVCHRN